ncbi:hypothetical protein FHR87_001964 [Azomonas macrocytogenes]|uniref:Uncharacterized protein n=1 Tax=Azomonas macrocytogenes TaxID=69962 RepID=A0A839T384_AZOMA|nr:hypothetical protein [Azomonas macrocytogenes]
MMGLAPSANSALSSARSAWILECGNSSAFGEYAAVALLPVDEKCHPKGDPALLQTSRDRMEWSGTQEKSNCSIIFTTAEMAREGQSSLW